MIIHINQQFRIASDRYQWKIEERRVRKGKLEWRSIRYYTRFESALSDLGEMLVRLSKAETFADALSDIKDVATTLSRALPRLEDDDWRQLVELKQEEMRNAKKLL